MPFERERGAQTRSAVQRGGGDRSPGKPGALQEPRNVEEAKEVVVGWRACGDLWLQGEGRWKEKERFLLL